MTILNSFLTTLLLSAFCLPLSAETQKRSALGENWKILSRGSFTTEAIGVNITNPGNYMVSESIVPTTGNGTALIQINTNDVVLDLANHTINGSNVAGKGIYINGVKNVTIKNGHINSAQNISLHIAAGSRNIRIENMTITSPGPTADVQLDSSNVKITGLTVIGNGTLGNALNIANNLNDITVDDIRISNISGKAISVGNSCYNIRLKNLEIDTCLGTNNAIALGTTCYDVVIDGFRLSNISTDGITIGNSSYGIPLKNGTITNCAGNGITIGSGTHGIHLNGLVITGCSNGILASGINGSIIENCTVSKNSGAGAFGCKLIASQNIVVLKSNFFESVSTGNSVYGMWLQTCTNVSCSNVQSGGHIGSQGFGFRLDTNCFGCTFENCVARGNYATSATAGQGAFGFSLSASNGCAFINCVSTSNQGALLAAGFYQSSCSANTFACCKALQNSVTPGSATALAAGFYSVSGASNKFQECEANGQTAGTVASTLGYGAAGFYLSNEQQSSLFQCKALGNGSVSNHAATAAGFYFDATLNPACKFLEIRECAATSNCTSATTGTTAYGFLDGATATTNIFLDCFASSNSDNASSRVVTNYSANLPIGGAAPANFPKVEATIDGLLDIANKPLFYNVSITS